MLSGIRRWWRDEARTAVRVGLVLGFIIGLLYAISIVRGAYDPWLVTRRAAAVYPILEAGWWGLFFLGAAAIIGTARCLVDRANRKSLPFPPVIMYGVLAVLLGILLLGVGADVVNTVLSAAPGGRRAAAAFGLLGLLIATRLRPPESRKSPASGGRRRVYPLVCLAAAIAVAVLALETLPPTAGGGAAVQTDGGGPNVLLITIDALRADSVGYASESAPATPNINQLAGRGVVFSNAFAQAPWTLPSISSMMTSLYPSEAGVALVPGEGSGWNRLALSDSVPTLAEVLQAAGYETAAQVTNPSTSSTFGVHRGFDAFRHSFDRKSRAPFCYRTALRLCPPLRARVKGIAQSRDDDADVITRAAATWLREERRDAFFLWVHYMDPHEQYGPPGSYAASGSVCRRLMRAAVEADSVAEAEAAKKELRELYDAEVTYCDQWVGELLRTVDDLGLTNRTMVILTADHGEAFWEHGTRGHGYTLHDEVLRVPLLVVFPDGRAAGATIREPARLLDIMPTVLEAAQVTPPPGVQGETLTRLLPGFSQDTDSRRPVFAECLWMPPEHKAMRGGRWLVTYRPADGSFEQFDQGTMCSGGEGSPPPALAQMQERLRAWADEMRTALDSRRGSLVALSEDEKKQLRAIGYVH